MNLAKVFIDTSAWIALVKARDQGHKKVEAVFEEIIEEEAGLFTSADVVDETVTRLVYDVGFWQARKFIKAYKERVNKGVLTTCLIDEQIQDEAFEIMGKYDDQKLSMTDATSVVLMKKYNIDAVLTLDSDFKKIGISSLPEGF